MQLGQLSNSNGRIAVYSRPLRLKAPRYVHVGHQRAICHPLEPSRVVCTAAGSTTNAFVQTRKFRRSIWTAVDVAALLGSVAGALAALLGVVSPTYALTLPLVLPVVSLIAALQREDLSNEEGRQQLTELSSLLTRDSSAALLRDAAAAIDEVRHEVRAQSAAAGRLAALEDKLAVLEGVVVGAARNSREAAAGVSALGASLSATLQQTAAMVQQQQHNPAATQQSAQLVAGVVAAEVLPLLKAELAGSLGPWLAEHSAALKQLDTRLAVVEGSLAGLEMSQSDSLMRLGSSFNSSMVDATSGLQSSVRVELAAAVEPLKQLPQLVSAAAAKAAATVAQQQQQQLLQVQQTSFGMAEQADASAEGALEPGASGAAGTAAGVVQLDQSLLVQQVQELVAAEVAAATQQVLEQQSVILANLGLAPRPTPLADEQWEALGRRLARLERLVQSLPELGEATLAGQLAPVVAAQQSAASAQEAAGSKLDRLDASLQHLAAAAPGAGLGGDGAAGSGAAAAGAAVYDRLDGLAREFEGIQTRLEQLTGQLLGSSAGSVEQLLLQLQDSMQQMLAYSVQQKQDGGGGGGAGIAEAVGTAGSLLAPMQQQLQQVAAVLQQVQQELPMQVCSALASSSSTSGGAAPDAFDGAVYDDGSTGGYAGSGLSSADAAVAAANAAASAASSAAAGVSELRHLLGGVQVACEDLQVQVGTLAAQVAAQQAAILSSAGSSGGLDDMAAAAAATASSANSLQSAQQQLVAASSRVSEELSEQLTNLCGSLQQQLQDLQQQLVDAASAAASQAAADAVAAAVRQQPEGVVYDYSNSYSNNGMTGTAPPATGDGNAAAAAAYGDTTPLPQQQQQQQVFGSPADGAFAPPDSSGIRPDISTKQPSPASGFSNSQLGGWDGLQPDAAASPTPGSAAAAADSWQAIAAAEQASAAGAAAAGSGEAAVAPPWSNGRLQGQLQMQPSQWNTAAAAGAAVVDAVGTPAAAPSAAAAAPLLQQQQEHQQQEQQQQQQQQEQQPVSIPDVPQLSEEQLRSEGLRLLRAGREATRGSGAYAASGGPDFAAAEMQLQAAVACFTAAVESEPQDTRALGNLGNALLAQGELKKALLDELLLSVGQGGLLGMGSGAAQSLGMAEGRLRAEACALLTRAGEIFRRVLEIDGWSSRALVNWGKAMVGRAELAVDGAAAVKLYNAAIDKFEAVLEEDPGLVVARYRCALAMQGLAALDPPQQQGAAPGSSSSSSSSSRQRLVLLSDAAAYLSDVVSGGAGGDAGLSEAAAVALRQVQQSLEVAKLK